MEPLKYRIIDLCQNAKQYENRWGISFSEIEKIIDDHFYHMALVEYSSKTESMLAFFTQPKIIIAHTKHKPLFITCDNPARPFYPYKLGSMVSDPLPGFIDPEIQLAYPISPFCCILVSSNPSWVNFEHREIKYNQVTNINQALAISAIREIICPGFDISLYLNNLDLSKLKAIRRP